MTNDDKQRALLAGIASALEAKTPITFRTTLADFVWDSMAHILVIGHIDEIFGVQIDGDSLASCATVGDLLALAERK